MAQEYIKLSHTDIETLITICEEVESLTIPEQSVLLKLKQIRLAQRAKLAASKSTRIPEVSK